MTASTYLLLADTVLTLHMAMLAFVIAGLVLIIGGNLRKWQWVNAYWFRLLHLGTIVFVVAEAWLDVVCPLTTLEMWLREKAHASTYSGSFIGHWLQRLLYHALPAWVFTLAYTLFGLLVAAAFWYFPPRRAGRRKTSA